MDVKMGVPGSRFGGTIGCLRDILGRFKGSWVKEFYGVIVDTLRIVLMFGLWWLDDGRMTKWYWDSVMTEAENNLGTCIKRLWTKGKDVMYRTFGLQFKSLSIEPFLFIPSVGVPENTLHLPPHSFVPRMIQLNLLKLICKISRAQKSLIYANNISNRAKVIPLS
ncbi:hypothetical protein RND71_034476 [Anisodus tanguticus]|uniref:Uncharacterized protein n=1 Tax=Anisodus tanguticus TaxID=243964 RepID=A0AAE1RCQ4_9SOLA|nr:hypothetical protein RND71_034476 [Anisodus tanguticus]